MCWSTFRKRKTLQGLKTKIFISGGRHILIFWERHFWIRERYGPTVALYWFHFVLGNALSIFGLRSLYHIVVLLLKRSSLCFWLYVINSGKAGCKTGGIESFCWYFLFGADMKNLMIPWPISYLSPHTLLVDSHHVARATACVESFALGPEL